MTITAAVVERQCGPFELQELELGDLRDGEVLVRVAASGICHTDLICRDGWLPVPLPAVLGHEGAGVVQAVGPGVTSLTVGDRVGMSYDSCGRCPACTKGLGAYCHAFFEHNFAASRPEDGSSALSLQGTPVHAHFFGQSSFATHAVARERNVVKLDDDVPFEVAAPFGCGIQTGAGSVLTHVVDASTADPVDEIRRATGAGADFALEATGSPQAVRAAVDALAPLGVCGVVGAPALGIEVSLDVTTVLTGGRVVRGIVEGESVPATFLPRLVDLWRSGELRSSGS